MKDIKKIEQTGRKTWLAGLGTVGKGKEATAQSLDQFADDANHTFSALIERGIQVEDTLKERFQLPQWLNQRIAAIRHRLAPGQDELEQVTERLDETLKLLDKLVAVEAERIKRVEAATSQVPAENTKKPATRRTAARSQSTSAKPAVEAKEGTGAPASKQNAAPASTRRKTTAQRKGASSTATKK